MGFKLGHSLLIGNSTLTDRYCTPCVFINHAIKEHVIKVFFPVNNSSTESIFVFPYPLVHAV